MEKMEGCQEWKDLVPTEVKVEECEEKTDELFITEVPTAMDDSENPPIADQEPNAQAAIYKPKTLEDFLPVLVSVWTQMSPELRHAYRIFKEIINEKTKSVTEPFLDAPDLSEVPDYLDVIKEPMDLFKISEKFNNMEYTSITEFVADIRQIIENCYRYNGTDHFISKQAYKLEVILEQKLALLSRNFRSKTTIAATNEFKNKEYLNALLFSTAKRRISLKPTNGETSLIAMQMQLQREIEDKERKRIKGKEKKEIIGARGEECEKWTRDVLNESFMEEIATTWEIPAVGIFIYILQEFLHLHDLNYCEFELGMMFPRESSLVAKIFTSLLVTPHQRKKLNSEEPMKYEVWSEKVQTKILSWYKMASTRGQEYTASLFGFDADLFDILGYSNPFDGVKFHELPLKSRMWILKSLCEAALEQDIALRDHFNELEFIDRQDLCIGYDAQGFSYHYISHFGATDIRIYKQKSIGDPGFPKTRDQPITIEKEEPATKDEKARVTRDAASEVKEDEEEKPAVRTSSRIAIKRSLTPPPFFIPTKKERKPKNTTKDFELVVTDVATLKSLFIKFDANVKARANRKTPERELHQSLDALYVELKKREMHFAKCDQKAKMKIMLECKKAEETAAKESAKEQNGGAEWDSENEDDYEDEAVSIPQKPRPGRSKEASPTMDFQPGQFEYDHTYVNSNSTSRRREGESDGCLSKEGRRKRNKKFDVKELFADPDIPPRKKPKVESVKPAQKKHTLENSRWARLGFGQSDPDDPPYTEDSDPTYVCGSSDYEKPRTPRNRYVQGSSSSVTRRQIFKSVRKKEDDISDSDILKLRKQRLMKIQSDLREGKTLSAEEERNLVHLGLSVKDVAALNTETLTKIARVGHQRGAEAAKVAQEKALAYDGLKALAAIASLAQKQAPKQSNSAEKPKVNIKFIFKQNPDPKQTTTISKVIVTEGQTGQVKDVQNGQAKGGPGSSEKQPDDSGGNCKTGIIATVVKSEVKKESPTAEGSKSNKQAQRIVDCKLSPTIKPNGTICLSLQPRTDTSTSSGIQENVSPTLKIVDSSKITASFSNAQVILLSKEDDKSPCSSVSNVTENIEKGSKIVIETLKPNNLLGAPKDMKVSASKKTVVVNSSANNTTPKNSAESSPAMTSSTLMLAKSTVSAKVTSGDTLTKANSILVAGKITPSREKPLILQRKRPNILRKPAPIVSSPALSTSGISSPGVPSPSVSSPGVSSLPVSVASSVVASLPMQLPKDAATVSGSETESLTALLTSNKAKTEQKSSLTSSTSEIKETKMKTQNLPVSKTVTTAKMSSEQTNLTSSKNVMKIAAMPFKSQAVSPLENISHTATLRQALVQSGQKKLTLAQTQGGGQSNVVVCHNNQVAQHTPVIPGKGVKAVGQSSSVKEQTGLATGQKNIITKPVSDMAGQSGLSPSQLYKMAGKSCLSPSQLLKMSGPSVQVTGDINKILGENDRVTGQEITVEKQTKRDSEQASKVLGQSSQGQSVEQVSRASGQTGPVKGQTVKGERQTIPVKGEAPKLIGHNVQVPVKVEKVAGQSSSVAGQIKEAVNQNSKAGGQVAKIVSPGNQVKGEVRLLIGQNNQVIGQIASPVAPGTQAAIQNVWTINQVGQIAGVSGGIVAQTTQVTGKVSQSIAQGAQQKTLIVSQGYKIASQSGSAGAQLHQLLQPKAVTSSALQSSLSLKSNLIQKIKTTNANASMFIVSEGSQLITQGGIPVILDAKAQQIVQAGNNNELSQPVLFLTTNQPLLDPTKFQENQLQQQQQQRLVIQQQGESCVLRLQPQQPLSNAKGAMATAGYPGGLINDTTKLALTKCPVTTLKSKLHAAALKKKGTRNRLSDALQRYKAITSRVTAPSDNLQNVGNKIQIVKKHQAIQPKSISIVKNVEADSLAAKAVPKSEPSTSAVTVTKDVAVRQEPIDQNLEGQKVAVVSAKIVASTGVQKSSSTMAISTSTSILSSGPFPSSGAVITAKAFPSAGSFPSTGTVPMVRVISSTGSCLSSGAALPTGAVLTTTAIAPTGTILSAGVIPCTGAIRSTVAIPCTGAIRPTVATPTTRAVASRAILSSISSTGAVPSRAILPAGGILPTGHASASSCCSTTSVVSPTLANNVKVHMRGIQEPFKIIPNSSVEQLTIIQTPNSQTKSKSVQIVKGVGNNNPIIATNPVNSAFFTSWTYAENPRKSKISVSKRRNSSPAKKSSTYKPIKPAISSTQSALVKSSSGFTQVTVTQVAPPIIVTPPGFSIGSPYHGTIPVGSLPAQIVQLPAQIPTKEVKSSANDISRGAATASQLVIVPQTKKHKEIRPASDSTSAVKALQLLDKVQTSKHGNCMLSTAGTELASVQSNVGSNMQAIIPGSISSTERPVLVVPSTTFSAIKSNMMKPNSNAKSTTTTTISTVNKTSSLPSSSLSRSSLPGSNVGISPPVTVSLSVEGLPVSSSTNSLSIGLPVNADIALKTVMDKSSVVYSIVAPIPSTEIKSHVQNSEGLDDKGLKN